MNLTGSEKDILSYLLDEPEATRYDTKKDLDMAYSTVHGSFESLEEKKLIKKAREGETEKGTAKTYFSLTPPGVLRAVSERVSPPHPERVLVTVEIEEDRPFTLELSIPELATWEDMPKAVERQLRPSVLEGLEECRRKKPYCKEVRKIVGKYRGFLPLILGKWDFFRERGIEEAVALSICNVPFESSRGCLAGEARAKSGNTHEAIETNFYSDLLSRYAELESASAMLRGSSGPKPSGVGLGEIVLALAEDPDLAPIVKRKVEKMHAKKRREYEMIDQFRNSLEGVS